jgi:4-carboxymuconolactone decarboxylase
MSDPTRIEKGIAVIQKLFGAGAGRTPMPDAFRRITAEHLFGDIWSRPGLELAERSMITVAALTVLGRESELRLHLNGARNLGISRDKLEEIMIHLAHYGGWPVAVAGFRALDEVFGPAENR